MLSIYATLSRCLLAVQKREGAAVCMQKTVFTLARLKIVPTIKNCITSNASVNELSSLVSLNKVPVSFPRQLLTKQAVVV